MKHECEDNIKCPYCNWENHNSLEFDQDYGEHTCGNCDKEFEVERNIIITYTTTPINCRNKGLTHKWELAYSHKMKEKYVDGKWVPKAENEITYNKKVICSVCHFEQFLPITKEEYETINAGVKIEADN